jgi:septum formation inhibitor MinC
VTVRLRRACDPLAIIYSVFRGQTDTFSIEFLLIPPHKPAGIIHIAMETPPFADRLKLKSFPLENKYCLWTDIGEMAGKFVESVKKFIESYPTSLELIELSDTNRFDARAQCRFVARFEFKICGTIEFFVTDELVDFCVNLADEFCMLKLTGSVQQRNQALRDTFVKEKDTEKEEKKPTADEEEKAQRKKERKEQKKLNPKVKVVRQ